MNQYIKMGTQIFLHGFVMLLMTISGAAYGMVQSVQENFCYDDLARLSDVMMNGTMDCADGYRYDSLGNLSVKDGVSAVYGNSQAGFGEVGPNQLNRLEKADGTTRTYLYDRLGNQTEANDGNGVPYQGNQWTAFGKPWIMTKLQSDGAISSSEFSYNPEGRRIHRRDYQAANGRLSNTHYAAGIYEQVEKNHQPTIYRHRLGGFASYNLANDGTATLTYWHHDHIGSLVAESRNMSEQETLTQQKLMLYRYDAWGAPIRNIAAAESEPLLSENTTHGFTGHEMLESVELIHMNGRVYDPELGRFLSADPYIQAPNNSQSYNRYAYVWNNPLSLVDPDGYRTKKKEDKQDEIPKESPLQEDRAKQIYNAFAACKENNCDDLNQLQESMSAAEHRFQLGLEMVYASLLPSLSDPKSKDHEFGSIISVSPDGKQIKVDSVWSEQCNLSSTCTFQAVAKKYGELLDSGFVPIATGHTHPSSHDGAHKISPHDAFFVNDRIDISNNQLDIGDFVVTRDSKGDRLAFIPADSLTKRYRDKNRKWIYGNQNNMSRQAIRHSDKARSKITLKANNAAWWFDLKPNLQTKRDLKQ